MHILSDVQELIRQLTQTEKRYFKIYAARHVLGAENAYLALYGELEKKKAWEAGKLGRKLGWDGKKLLASGRYLYQLLLRSLRAYRQEKSVAIRLHDLQDEAELLREKGLFAQARRLLVKARRLALKYDDFLAALAILEAERRLPDEHAVDEAAVRAEKARLLGLVREEQAFRDLYDTVFAGVRRAGALSEAAYAAARAAVGEQPEGFFARLYDLAAGAVYAHAAGDLLAAEAAYAAVTTHWERHPHMCTRHPDRHQAALANHLGICYQLQRRAEVAALLPRCAPRPGAHRRQQWDHFRKVLAPQLTYHLNGGNLAAAVGLVPALGEGLARFQDELPQSLALTLRYNVAVVHFLRGEAEAALSWLQGILELPASGPREDIRAFARVMQLLLHLELRNLRVLPYLLRNVRRQLRQWGRLLPLEMALLSYVRECLAAVDARDETQAGVCLQQKLEAQVNGPAALGMSECLLWIREKVAGG